MAAGLGLAIAATAAAPAAGGADPQVRPSQGQLPAGDAELLRDLDLLLDWELLLEWDPVEDLPIPVDEPDGNGAGSEPRAVSPRPPEGER